MINDSQIYSNEITITGKGHQLPVKLYVLYMRQRDILPINEAEENLTTERGVFNSSQATVNGYKNDKSILKVVKVSCAA